MSVNPTEVPGIRYGELVERRAARQPDRPAILFDGTAMTYRELSERISAFHAALLEVGVRPGNRVLCMSGNRPEILIALFATGRCGAIFVPVNPAAPAIEIAGLVRDSAPAVALWDEDTRVVLEQAVGLSGCEGDSPPVRLRSIDAPRPVPAIAPAPHPVGPDDPAQLIYTSGTTGTPKGVVLTHGALFWNQINLLLGLDVCSDDVTLVNTPMFHVAGLNTLAVATLGKGGTVVLHRRFDAEACLRAVREHRVTTLFAVPTMLGLLSRHDAFPAADLSSLRWILSGGSALPPDAVTVWARLGVPVLASYGLSEALSVSFRTPTQAAAKAVSSGPPALLTELCVVGPDGSALDPGEIGEVVVRGSHVAAGYWNRPDATEEAFRDDGLHTGDRGMIDADGSVVIMGRIKDMIITGGENVDPVEVEHAVAAHPAVAEAVVVGVADPLWGECVGVVIVPAGPNPPSLSELQEFLAPRISRYKVPRRLQTADTLPRTPAGKILRTEVGRLLNDHGDTSPAKTP
ncbi:AMP-binding protein [Streptomyces plumbiresistens]|uniref:Long-chain fatty acid--CoA ligase n=1 Tax=Streptomyces plumbiresistens TaxID=511811 RepID=A0ABP7TEF1_9ACTN